ncbi:hypothetical protein FR773_13965 [Leclercia adecarboxylata]|nr:hypothetical protein FR773_13965 [Leclercia adecarboxylata]
MLATGQPRCRTIFFDIYPSYFRLSACWLDSAVGLAPLGPAQALCKTVNRFVMQLELFRV